MRYALGRFLQVLGMATTLVGLLVGINLSNARYELIYCGVGIVIFFVGYLVQGKQTN